MTMELIMKNRDHKVGDYVTYGSNGICKIKSILKQNFSVLGEAEYYELVKVYDEKTVIFVPVNSESLTSQMRHVLSPDEIEEIISRTEKDESEWIEDAKERAQAFGEILQSGDREKILWVIKVVSIYKKSLEEQKKKFYATDQRILQAAEKIITEEFSFVLGIKKEEIIPYIISKYEH